MNVINEDIVSLLAELDISRNEAVTYQALLQLESVSIRKIAAATGINRGTTYESLKKLLTTGLVSTKRIEKRDYYTAESPEKIYNLIREKRQDLLDASNRAKQIVPTLLAQNAQPLGKPIVRYYEDDEGVVTILKDVLQTCSLLSDPQYYAYSSSAVRQYLYRQFPQFTERRIADGINVRVIAVGEGGEIATNSERKWLPTPTSGQISSYTIIYANKVAIISLTSNNTPYGVVIEDQGGAAMQRLLFDQLWQYIDAEHADVQNL